MTEPAPVTEHPTVAALPTSERVPVLQVVAELDEIRRLLFPDHAPPRTPHARGNGLTAPIRWLLQQRITLTEALDRAEHELAQLGHVTDAQAQAAADEWGRHHVRAHRDGDGVYEWFCDCGATTFGLPDAHEAARTGELHEFREAIRVALAQGAALADREPKALTPNTPPAPAVIDAQAQWWCDQCGNRYSNATGQLIGECSCGQPLQAITLQIVTRVIE